MAPCETPANFAIVAIVIGLVGPPVSLAARFTPGIPLDPKDSPSEGWFIVRRREGFTRNSQAKSRIDREKCGRLEGLGTLFLNFGLWFGQEVAQHERQNGDAHGDVASGLGDVHRLGVAACDHRGDDVGRQQSRAGADHPPAEIGRASCRERV